MSNQSPADDDNHEVEDIALLRLRLAGSEPAVALSAVQDYLAGCPWPDGLAWETMLVRHQNAYELGRHAAAQLNSLGLLGLPVHPTLADVLRQLVEAIDL